MSPLHGPFRTETTPGFCHDLLRLKIPYGIRENRDYDTMKDYDLLFVPSTEVMAEKDQEALVELGSLPLCAAAEGVAVDGSYAFVAAGECGLRVVDVSVATAPVEIGFLDTPYHASGVVARAGLVYLADGAGGLRVIDVTTASAPVELGAVPVPGEAKRLAVDGDHAYLACGQDGFHVADVADPFQPTIVGGLFGVSAADVAVGTSSVFVANSYLGMITVDVGDPAAPSWSGSHFAAGLVDAAVRSTREHGAAVPLLDVVDTVKRRQGGDAGARRPRHGVEERGLTGAGRGGGAGHLLPAGRAARDLRQPLRGRWERRPRQL